MKEPMDLAEAVQFDALLLEAANAQHLTKKSNFMLMRHRRCFWFKECAHWFNSNVEMSPSGRPISRALSRRRMIFPLRVWGRTVTNSISFGATTAPRRTRAKPSSSRFRDTEGL